MALTRRPTQHDINVAEPLSQLTVAQRQGLKTRCVENVFYPRRFNARPSPM